MLCPLVALRHKKISNISYADSFLLKDINQPSCIVCSSRITDKTLILMQCLLTKRKSEFTQFMFILTSSKNSIFLTLLIFFHITNDLTTLSKIVKVQILEKNCWNLLMLLHKEPDWHPFKQWTTFLEAERWLTELKFWNLALLAYWKAIPILPRYKIAISTLIRIRISWRELFRSARTS